MVPRSLKAGLLAGLVAYLAGALPLAAAARPPAGFRAQERSENAINARASSPCDTVRCGWGQVCQPSVDGKKATCVDIPPEGLCGTIACPPGTECCNRILGICLKPGSPCPRAVSEDLETRETTVKCGHVSCGAGTVCCNSSCGICVKPGGACTQQICEDKAKCGSVTCQAGTVCCNASCGICVRPGGSCTQQICTDKQVQ